MRRSAIYLALSLAISLSGFAITEEEYRSKYAFPVDGDSGDFEDHPNTEYRVFTRYGIRECDVDDGNVVVLAFYDGDNLLRQYTLKQLFPEEQDWEFHQASGVFLWLIFNPKVNGFHDTRFSALTVSGVQTFAVNTGARIEIKKQNKMLR